VSELAIRVEKLSKKYRIGEARAGYRTLRDSMTRAITAPVRRLTGMLKGEAYAGADLGESIWALKDIEFEIRQGEVVGIIGRNGAGKTTLLKILSRITEPTEGYADVWGRVGSLLEVGVGFHPELTGRENIWLNGAILGMRRTEIERKYNEIVEFAEIERFIDTPMKHYSSGMQVRLAFAIAAHLEPEILLIDEVLAVGDIEFQKKCLGKMSEISRGGRTVLFVSHQMNQIRRLCERCFWIHNGCLELDGPTVEVVSAYEGSASTLTLCERESADGQASPATRFLDWEVIEPRMPQKNMIATLGPVVIRMNVRVTKPVEHGHHGIALFSMDNQLMWSWAIDNLKLQPGINEFIYRLPTLPLKPGTYSWHVSLYDEGELLDQWHCPPELIVASEPLTHRLDHWTGILNVPCDFQVALKKRDARG